MSGEEIARAEREKRQADHDRRVREVEERMAADEAERQRNRPLGPMGESHA